MQQLWLGSRQENCDCREGNVGCLYSGFFNYFELFISGSVFVC
ncbi:hypothetical protein WN943_019184 [Citrus x changshan-huyou]